METAHGDNSCLQQLSAGINDRSLADKPGNCEGGCHYVSIVR